MKNRIFSSPFSRLPLSYLLLPFLTFFLASVASAQIPSSGLVGYWPFSGNANDESGNGNNGTVNGATLTTDRFGNASSAYGFNNNSTEYIEISESPELNNCPEITISLWTKVLSWNQYNMFMGKTGNNATTWNILSDNANGNVLIFRKTSAPAMPQDYLSSIGVPSFGTWHHLVFSYSFNGSSGACKFYLDGNLIETYSNTSYLGISNYPVRIGSDGTAVANTVDGFMDDVAIYNRALTPTEVAQLYTTTSSTLPPPCTAFLGEDQTVCAGTSVTLSAIGSSLACPTLPSTLQNGLVGYWPFCGNANDASGNGNNGTVNGATLTADRFGNGSSAYSFDGVNDVISVPNSPTFSIFGSNQPSTISFWVKKNNNSDCYFICKGLHTDGCNLGNKYFNVTWVSTNGLLYNLYNSTTMTSVQSGSSYDLLNQWNHVAIVRNAQTKLYINGIDVSSNVSNAGWGVDYNSSLATNLTFGAKNNVSANCANYFYDYFFNGNLDEVSIHSRALSVAEIQQLYTLGQSTYLWSTGATTATINVTPTTTTTYTCTVTDANGNVCTDSVTVFVPQIEATDLTICTGETTTLSVSGITSNNCQALSTNLQTGLVGYWPFCGNANDESGNGNSGTVNGATLTADRFGNANGAYSFDGNSSKIIVPNSSSLELGFSDYTLSAWIRTNSQNTTNGRIISKGSSACITGYMMRTGSPNSSKIHTENAFNLNCYVANSSIGSVNNFQWRMVTVTITRNQGVKFYIDGVFDSEYNVNSQYDLSNGQNLFFGFNNLSTFEPFLGDIDDIAIYNRALTAAEIQQLYALGQTTYLWSNGATTPTINVSPTSTTTYTCTVTTNGVSCTDSVIVVVSNPVIDLGADVTVCGTSTTLTASSGYDSYLWSNGGTTNTTTISANGTYTCTVTQGGCSATDAVDVTLVNATISAIDSVLCANQSTTLSVNAIPSATYNPALFPNQVEFNGHFYSKYTGTANWFDAKSISESNGGYLAIPNSSLESDFIENLSGIDGTSYPYTWMGMSDQISEGTWIDVLGNLVSFFYWAPGEPNNSNNEDFGLIYSNNNSPGTWNDGHHIQTLPFVMERNSIPLSILWSTGATTPTINVSPTSTTTYTCTVTTNGVSCTDSVTVVVSQPLASISPNGIVEICQGQSIALTANGGVSYSWSTGAPTQSITVNTEAVYSVTVTDANGCTDTESQLVKVNFLPNIGVNSASICPGQSTTLTATGGLSYEWSPAAGLSATTGATVTASPSTSTVYTVTGTGANGCTNTATAAVAVNALPTSTITPASATTFCQGGSVVLTANIGTGLTYQWRLNGTNITGATSSTYTANASGSYTVVVTNTSTCSATSTATVVTVNALPTFTITASSATTFCQGGSVVLTANTGTGLSYQWFNNAVAISGATTSSYTANASGSYTVIVTNTSTCSATSTATVVTVNAAPTATITPATATTFCQGGSVVLNANTGTGLSYQWFNNTVAISGATSSSYTANASGSYTVVVTNTSTCSATSTATVVTVNALPTATITASSATTFCQGGSVVLNSNTGAGLSYQWRLNGTNITGATSSSYTANASGSYTVVVTNTSTCTATSTATVVTVNALPTATITPATTTTFCQGGSVVLNANTGTGLTYQWRLNGTNITGATSSSYTANASGSYTVVVTNTSTCSATSTATIVTVNALPTATITAVTATTFCQGGSVVLNANTGTGLSYQWRLNGTNITGATSSSYTANASGSYTVVVTNTSTCSATSTVTVVTVNALPSATITPATVTTFCQGGSVVLNANTGTGLSYQWYNNASIITGATTSSYTANASGSYTVVVTNTSTCSATSTATVVTVNALPTATITASSATTFCQGGSVVLTANTGTGLTYQWRLNGTNITGATSASYTANASGSYTVVVTNTSTCSATSTAINVTAVPNVDYFADADGDGFGDVATLISTCVQPQGYVTDNTDCDDTSADVNPAAAEVCNHIDDDCSETIDDGLVFDTYYADVDGDTFGDANNSIYECSQPSGYVTNNTDCNDNNANQNAASTEICNGEDDDCDGAIDNGLIFLDYYADLDSDGFGAGAATNSCVDLGAGYVTNNTDCNDNNANQNTASTEICNGEDDDCDGAIDNGITFLDYYADADGDGFGAGDVISSCSDLGIGYSTNNTDCDDSNSNINSSATETCNTIDDNCDGQIDEGVQTVYFIDNDGDTYGNPSMSILACTQPIGYTPDDTDCNDTDANINPGAEDIGGNGIDENCDGEIDNSIFELNATISLYPNPTRSELNIQVNSSVIGSDLYIFDALGKLVFKQQLLSTQTSISVSNLADGNYVVRVGEVVKRFEVIK